MIVRPMALDDLAELIDLQEAGAIAALAAVFPQDRYPFPRDAIAARWRQEIGDPTIDTYVAVDDRQRLAGFAAITGSELLHFGTAIETWGDGTATELHDIVVSWLRSREGPPVLFVFADNPRARRFYEKQRWQPTGTTLNSRFPPYPLLVKYTLPAT